jgi:hypothetical protein
MSAPDAASGITARMTNGLIADYVAVEESRKANRHRIDAKISGTQAGAHRTDQSTAY